jgi:hypothetical protein
VGTCVHEPIAEWWAAAEETACTEGQIPHRGASPDLYAAAFALRHPAEERHDEVMRFGSRVDRTADLWNPKLNSVVGEDRKSEAELVAIESALRFADHYALEATAGV